MTTTIEDEDIGTGQGRASGRRGRESGSPLDAVKDSAADAYQTARERTSAAYAAARTGASKVGRRTADEVQANPMIALAGGLVLGAIAAAFIPRTRGEAKLLGAAGRRINDSAREATRVARKAGKEHLDALGISREAARRKLDEFTDRAVSAIGSSAGPAAKKARGKRGK